MELFTTSANEVRRPRPPQHIARDVRMLAHMLDIYCTGQGHSRQGNADSAGESVALCTDCGSLLAYAKRRLVACPHGDNKPTCARCTIHCYAALPREQIRQVMRYAGPRMLWRHPLFTLLHTWESVRTRFGFLGDQWHRRSSHPTPGKP